jgi:DNA-binding FadR family transcriptional regulator
MSLATYLEFLNIESSELFAARALIDGLAAKLAAERADIGRASALRTLDLMPGRTDVGQLAKSRASMKHTAAVACLSGNPLLEIFSEVLRQASLEILAGPSGEGVFDAIAAGSVAYRAALSEAIVAGDADQTCYLAVSWYTTTFPALMKEAVEAARTGQSMIGREGLDFEMNVRWVLFGRRSKTAEVLVRLILREVRLRGLASGERLGSEAEFLERYAIARPVLREAVRMLERHGIVHSRVGKSGGLYVGSADPGPTVTSFANHLHAINVSPEHVAEVRLKLEPELARQAAMRTAPNQRGLDPRLPAVAAAGWTAGLNIIPLFLQALYAFAPDQFKNRSELPVSVTRGDGALAYRAVAEQLRDPG